MLQLQEEIARIHESMASVNAEFLDHKRATNSVHNKLQSQVAGLEDGRRRQTPMEPQAPSPSYAPEPFAEAQATAVSPYPAVHPAGLPPPSRWMHAPGPAGVPLSA